MRHLPFRRCFVFMIALGGSAVWAASDDPCLPYIELAMEPQFAKGLDRYAAKRELARRERVQKRISTLTRMGDFDTSAINAEMRQEMRLLRILPTFENPNFLITHWEPFLKEFESNILEYQKNLDLIWDSGRVSKMIRRGPRMTPRLRNEVEGFMRRYRIEPTDEYRKALAMGDAEGILAELAKIEKNTEMENESIQGYVGRHSTRYLMVRREIDKLLDPKESRALENVRTVLDRPSSRGHESTVAAAGARGPSPAMALMSDPPPPPPIEEVLAFEQTKVKDWMREFSLGRKTSADLEQYADEHGLGSRTLPEVLGKWAEAERAQQPISAELRSEILEELENFEAELSAAHRTVTAVRKLDRRLSPNVESRATFAAILPKGATRPTVEQVETIARSPVAIRAKDRSDEVKEIARFTAGFVAKASRDKVNNLSKISLAGGEIKDPFTLKIIKDVHAYVTRSVHEEPIQILRGMREADPHTLKSTVELFASGPNGDEFLRTFALYSDMKEQWIAVQKLSETLKDIEPSPLYQRMQNAKKVVADLKLDTISPLSEKDFLKRSAVRFLAQTTGLVVFGGAGLTWVANNVPEDAKKLATAAMKKFNDTLKRMANGLANEEDVKKSAVELEKRLQPFQPPTL